MPSLPSCSFMGSSSSSATAADTASGARILQGFESGRLGAKGCGKGRLYPEAVMEVRIEDVSPVEKKLVVSVPWTTVSG